MSSSGLDSLHILGDRNYRGTITDGDVLIESLSVDTEPQLKDLIRRNLQGYEEAGSVLAATFRRLGSLLPLYNQDGSRFLVMRDVSSEGKPCVGGAGIGPLHGLPPSEGLGEVRDLVLEEQYRGHGLGARLLKRCIEEAKNLGYKHLYLETTPQMENAQKLFIRFGFRPITQTQQDPQTFRADGRRDRSEDGNAASQLAPPPNCMPCYFILDNLAG